MVIRYEGYSRSYIKFFEFLRIMQMKSEINVPFRDCLLFRMFNKGSDYWLRYIPIIIMRNIYIWIH